MWSSVTCAAGQRGHREFLSIQAAPAESDSLVNNSSSIVQFFSSLRTWPGGRAVDNPKMSAAQASQGLVSKLPVRLRNFFAKYPPQIYSATVAPRPSPPAPASDNPVSQETSSPIMTALEPLPSPYSPNRDARGAHRPDPKAWSPSKALLYSNKDKPNPFLPVKNFRTGKWYGARIGLRQQADLVKLAKRYGVEQLLPPGRKSSEFKETRRLERGLQIKGTGIGQKVKGHRWERTMETRLEERRKAMLEMPELIRSWKQVRLPFPFQTVNSWKNSNVLIIYPKFREVTEEDGRSGPGGDRSLVLHPFFFFSFIPALMEVLCLSALSISSRIHVGEIVYCIRNGFKIRLFYSKRGKGERISISQYVL
jgi:large subunit ribosomal protein L25